MGKGYRTVNVEDAVSGRVVIQNQYWLCKDSDPKQAIFFNETAQCNRHRQIPERMLEYTKDKTGWDVGIVFLETAFRPQIDFHQ